MIATLPEPLSRAIEAEIASIPASVLRAAATALSGAYRGKTVLGSALSPADRAAYLAVRFPSTFAVAKAVWNELANVIPMNGIRSVLDIGAGPGTAALAAQDIVDPGTRYTYLERDRGWLAPAQRLATAIGVAPEIKHAALTRDTKLDPHDIVVACYALNELPPPERAAVVDTLWRAAKTALIIIEPGTPKGFDVVRSAREALLAQAAHAAAPCTHDAVCPMSVADWCHRPERVARSATHRGAKQAQLGFEDEKFSFVILTREPPRRFSTGRIVRKPMRNAGHVHLDLCTAEGLRRVTVARSDGPSYRDARDAAWGDVWPPYED
ncbi:MAG: small ribosomal subunit Rsm22 family protein [Alphaproteobacteria bacterium]|nr:small ribosomal subunit Rsm22 family protein [Alphaproteobacteria bacterium]